MPDPHRDNLLLGTLDGEQRDVVSGMLHDAFVSGVHTTLRVLHDGGVTPFNDGVEGTPFNDFVGRLSGRPWPDS